MKILNVSSMVMMEWIIWTTILKNVKLYSRNHKGLQRHLICQLTLNNERVKKFEPPLVIPVSQFQCSLDIFPNVQTYVYQLLLVSGLW